jgi:hypothetical protein
MSRRWWLVPVVLLGGWEPNWRAGSDEVSGEAFVSASAPLVLPVSWSVEGLDRRFLEDETYRITVTASIAAETVGAPVQVRLETPTAVGLGDDVLDESPGLAAVSAVVPCGDESCAYEHVVVVTTSSAEPVRITWTVAADAGFPCCYPCAADPKEIPLVTVDAGS